MRSAILSVASILVLAVGVGCATSYRSPVHDPALDDAQPSAGRLPNHPTVRVYGVDGSLLSGELLNGTVTIDSGQGQLVLLTDHIHLIELANDADTIDSDSVKLSGKIRDTAFLLRNEHGVFTLLKDRIRQIDFVEPGTPAVAATRAPDSGSRRATRAASTTA